MDDKGVKNLKKFKSKFTAGKKNGSPIKLMRLIADDLKRLLG